MLWSHVVGVPLVNPVQKRRHLVIARYLNLSETSLAIKASLYCWGGAYAHTNAENATKSVLRGLKHQATFQSPPVNYTMMKLSCQSRSISVLFPGDLQTHVS